MSVTFSCVKCDWTTHSTDEHDAGWRAWEDPPTGGMQTDDFRWEGVNSDGRGNWWVSRSIRTVRRAELRSTEIEACRAAWSSGESASGEPLMYYVMVWSKFHDDGQGQCSPCATEAEAVALFDVTVGEYRARELAACDDDRAATLERIAYMLMQPIRAQLERHLDEHGCGCPQGKWCPSAEIHELNGGHAVGGFSHCVEADYLFSMLPAAERVIVA